MADILAIFSGLACSKANKFSLMFDILRTELEFSVFQTNTPRISKSIVKLRKQNENQSNL